MSKEQALQAQTYRACKQTCQDNAARCHHQCSENCRQCEIKAISETKKNYKKYIHERCVEGKTFIRRLQSYHDPLQCRKMSCDCPADYRVCVEACRGKIHKRIQVEKTCC